MLILTRKVGESIMVGDDIKITVLGVHGRQTRIGIDALKSVPVHREEIYIKIQDEQKVIQENEKGPILTTISNMIAKIKKP